MGGVMWDVGVRGVGAGGTWDEVLIAGKCAPTPYR